MTHSEIEEQAAAFMARRMSRSATAEDEQALTDWLALSPENRRIWAEYMAVEDRIDGAADTLAASALERDLEEFATQDANQPPLQTWFAAMAAGFALVIVSAAIFMHSPIDTQTYATAKGQRAEYTLADNSVVTLNTDSELTVTLTHDERRVALVRGEIMFDVVRDPQRPFVVTTPTADVSVIGTRFNIREAGPGAAISVLSGVVRVSPSDAQDTAAAATTLIAGQQAAFEENGPNKLEIRTFNPDTVTSWRRGRAYYDNESLMNVVADLNRYFPASINLAEPSLSSLRVTGGFDLSNQDTAIEALTVALSLRAERSDANTIMLHPGEKYED
ncbi:MAG: FecR domain-containing protein [Pseudomonadota bacterium]